MPVTTKLVEHALNHVPPGACVEEIVTADGIRLRVAYWLSASPSRGTILLVQGRTEFIEKYLETIDDLRQRGFAVVTFDWRGQGGSERVVANGCHIEGFSDYDRDLDAILRQIVWPQCPRPVTAMAHSMGALACLRAAHDKRARFERMILLAPMLGLSPASAPPMSVVRLLTGVALFFGRDTYPIANRALKARDEPQNEPRQQRIEALLQSAPELRSGWPTVRWIYSAVRAMQQTGARDFASEIEVPVLLIAPGRDTIVSNEAIGALANRLSNAAQATIDVAWHEVLMDSDKVRSEFWASFDKFLANQHLALPSSVG